MKKFFENHDLFKIVGIVLLFTVLLTWLIPVGYFSGDEMVIGDITRIGIMDFFNYGLLGIYYFAVLVTFLLVLGAFYQLLTKTKAYQVLIEKIVKLLKGKEILFILVTSLALAAIVAFSNEVYQVLIFVPMIITILARLKIDKITALCTTFGSMIIGLVGALYSTVILEYLVYYLELTYTSQIIARVVLFVAAYGLFNFFTIKHVKKTLAKSSKSEAIVDKFAVEKVTVSKTTKAKKESVKVWPLIVIFAIILIYQIIGYIGWKDVFGVAVFTNFQTWLTELSIGNHQILTYILGTTAEFGSWDLYAIQIIMIISTIVLAIVYKISLNDYIESLFQGAKKMCRYVVLAILIYTVCVFGVMYAFVPTIVDWIMSLAHGFNVYLCALSAFIASFFSVEIRYALSSLGTYFATVYGSSANNGVIMLSFQSMYGFTQFFAPTSILLMIGLAYLNIPYKNWMKYIWKFLIALLVVILIVLSIVAFV